MLNLLLILINWSEPVITFPNLYPFTKKSNPHTPIELEANSRN